MDGEDIVFTPRQSSEDLETLKINPLLANWIVIKRSQFVALFFSIGLGLALLVVVATKDIAFAWSTTLQITPESFHTFLEMLATPWKTWFPSAVPSLELIEKSQYFRLGDSLSARDDKQCIYTWRVVEVFSFCNTFLCHYFTFFHLCIIFIWTTCSSEKVTLFT